MLQVLNIHVTDANMHFTDANMLVTEAYMHVADAYMHFTDSNMRADTATTLNCQILIRAHPFEHMPFHGKNRQDFVIWRTTYSGIQSDQFDLDNPDHEEKLGYGRAIMFFSCKVRPSERLPV